MDLEPKPKSYQLVPLKTTLEANAREKSIAVYITTVPVKLASSVLNIIRKIIPDDGGHNLQHLRRFAKDADLPMRVRGHPSSDLLPVDTDNTDKKGDLKSCRLHVILAPVGSIPSKTLEDVLIILDENYTWSIRSVDVPALAPTSQQQATEWTSSQWPTVYKKNNPFGPHPSLVARAEAEMERELGTWMTLAFQVATDAKVTGRGEGIGVVVVERKAARGEVVAVAGDARWGDWEHGGDGNVLGHAVLRAIGMVADGLRRRYVGDVATSNIHREEVFQTETVGQIERGNLRALGHEEGYLCQNLEIYCTHEPCVMCSMAIVHSRFARVVFRHRMFGTGGLQAENALGLGLGWRRELNWSVLGWWCCGMEGGGCADEEGIRVEAGVNA